ncbi:unnamed protein product, partial [Polarella glacialis]
APMQASGQPPARLGVARDAEPEWTSHSSQNQASVPHSTMSMVPGAQPGVVNGSFRPVLTRQAVGSMEIPPGQNSAEADYYASMPDQSFSSAPRGLEVERLSRLGSGGSVLAGRSSPPRRGSGPLDPSLSGSDKTGGTLPMDDIHAALMKLADDFPVVHRMQRINCGFYRIDGAGTDPCELSLARNSDKLFAKLDSWNRGVRGELVKFLQAISDSPDGDLNEMPA